MSKKSEMSIPRAASYQAPLVENTRRIIASKGLKNKAVAARAGLSEKQLSALLNRRRIIRATDVAALANALEVTPNDLFGVGAGEEAHT